MPIFEYGCKHCNQEFEVLVQGNRQPLCPQCRGKNLHKRFSAFAVRDKDSSGAFREPIGPCGTCGDPRGAGACSLN